MLTKECSNVRRNIDGEANWWNNWTRDLILPRWINIFFLTKCIETYMAPPVEFSSVQFSCSVVSNSLRPDESHHARPPCPSPTPGVHSDSLRVHRVSDAIQPSYPLLSPFPPAPNPPQHQGLFQWVNSSHEVARVLELQHQSFQWTPRTGLL